MLSEVKFVYFLTRHTLDCSALLSSAGDDECLERGLIEDNVAVDARYPGSPSEPVAMARRISFVCTITVWHLRTRDTRPLLPKSVKFPSQKQEPRCPRPRSDPKGPALGQPPSSNEAAHHEPTTAPSPKYTSPPPALLLNSVKPRERSSTSHGELGFWFLGGGRGGVDRGV